MLRECLGEYDSPLQNNVFNHNEETKMKKTILTTTIALLLGVGTLQNAHADLNDGLVAHWSFDDYRVTTNN